MSRKKLFCLIILGVLTFSNSVVYAEVGDLGFFGGISEGRKLPKTTEQLIKKNKASGNEIKVPYKELIFLTGVPTEFNGNMTYSIRGGATSDFGSYKTAYKVLKGGNSVTGIEISRNIEYNVNYRKEENQIIKDYEVSRWSEKIINDNKVFELDPTASNSSISIIEDKAPGVTYYKGDISHRAVYTSENETTTYDITGVLYGYTSAWGSTETQRLNCTVSNKNWQMEFQIRPSVSLNKSLQYSKNEPTSISFDGNYKEVMQNKSGLKYNIYTLPSQFYFEKRQGSLSIPSFNTFEQLIAPDTSFLKGHFAESDIKKLFAMKILTGEPKFYQPNQAITRGQFTEMLVRAIKLPIEQMDKKTTPSLEIAFSDVMPERKEYPYIMEAFKTGLAIGKNDGRFHTDEPLERQEAIVILLRSLGLENLGLDPTPITPFVDDEYIAPWAKKEVYAANRIGIISGDEDGKFKPKTFINKAEAAAIINRLIEYMRNDMQVDYTENIVNFAD